MAGLRAIAKVIIPLNSQLSTLNSQLSVLNSQFSTLSSQLVVSSSVLRLSGVRSEGPSARISHTTKVQKILQTTKFGLFVWCEKSVNFKAISPKFKIEVQNL